APRDGQSLSFAPAARGGRRVVAPAAPPPPVEPIGGGATPDAAGLERLWNALRDSSGVQAFSLRELARAWFGEGAGAAEEEQLAAALAAGSPFFVPLPHAPGLWRLP